MLHRTFSRALPGPLSSVAGIPAAVVAFGSWRGCQNHYRPRRSISTLGVVGAGQMGTGIAIVGAQHAKLDVLLVDSSETQLDKATKFIASYCSKNVEKGKMTAEDAAAVKSRVKTFKSLQEFKSAQFVVEAATEDLDVKLTLFKQIADITGPDTILATNTSSISITKVAQVRKKRPSDLAAGWWVFHVCFHRRDKRHVVDSTTSHQPPCGPPCVPYCRICVLSFCLSLFLVHRRLRTQQTSSGCTS